MRKIFATIWFSILILTGAITSPMLGYAEDSGAGFSSYGLVSKIVGDSPDDLFTTMFTSEKNAGKDLYNAMMVKKEVEPYDEALKLVAQKWGFTLTEASQSLHWDVSPLIQKYTNMTIEDAYERLRQFQSDFKALVATVTEQKQLENEVKMVEMFANGDISDSGFDLVYDLDIIEQILFLKGSESEVYAGDAPKDETPGPEKGDEIKSEFTPYPYGGTTVPAQTEEKVEAPKIGRETSVTEAPAKTEPVPAESEVILETFADGGVDRDTCNASTELSTGLENFEAGATGTEKDTGTSTTAKTQTPSTETSKTQRKSEDNKPGTNTGAGDIALSPNPATTETEESKTEAKTEEDKEKSSWLKKKECAAGDFVCVNLEFIYKKASAFNNSDNCIACHIEKTNDAFEKTIRKTMLPSKVTGNLFESGKCKSGFSLPSLINLNIIMVPMPPLPPVNDELIFFHSFENEFKKFLSRFAPETIAEVLGAEAKDKSSQTEEMTISEMSYSNNETTMTEMFKNIEDAKAQAEREVAKRLETLQKTENVESKSEFFQSVGGEIDQMNMYFNSFKYVFEKIKEPCYATANKGDVQ